SLCISAGMHGSTMNVYVGLDECRAMAFTLHVLRPGDLFVDVGANVGAYSVLASGAVGSRTIAFEPGPAAFRSLRRNIRVNDLSGLADCRQVALSDHPGEI